MTLISNIIHFLVKKHLTLVWIENYLVEWWFKKYEEQVINELVEYCHQRAEESGVKGGYYEKVAAILIKVILVKMK